jgi:hypothetical protein
VGEGSINDQYLGCDIKFSGFDGWWCLIDSLLVLLLLLLLLLFCAV